MNIETPTAQSSAPTAAPSAPRILFVDHSAALGGAELYLLDVAQAFRDRCRVVLFESGPFRDRLVKAGVETEVLDAPSAILNVRKESGAVSLLRSLPSLPRLIYRLHRVARGYDVLYANSQKAFLVSALAGLLGRQTVIWNLHDMFNNQHFSPKTRRLAVATATRFASWVVANSEATRQSFVEHGGSPDRTSVVYNGLDPARFAEPAPGERAVRRTELGLDDRPVLGIFSRLAPWKGQHVLLDAVRSLPDVQVLLVGEALFDGDRSYAEQLRVTVAEQGLSERVRFMGFQEEVAPLLHTCDLIVHASTAPEPFGRVIVEGMLAGKPVIASRAGGAREIVQHGTNGLLVPPGDTAALRGAIQTLLEHPTEARSLARRGRRDATQRYSIPSMVAGVEHAIQRARSSAAVDRSTAPDA